MSASACAPARSLGLLPGEGRRVVETRREIVVVGCVVLQIETFSNEMLHNVRQEFMVNNYTVNETLQPCLSQNDCLLFLPIALLMIKTCVLSVTYTTRRRLRLHVEEGL